SGAQVLSCFGVVALKEQQDTEVCPPIDILRIERNDFAQHRNGELRLLFLKILLDLLLKRSGFGLNVLRALRHQSRPKHHEEKCAGGSEKKTSHVGTLLRPAYAAGRIFKTGIWQPTPFGERAH